MKTSTGPCSTLSTLRLPRKRCCPRHNTKEAEGTEGEAGAKKEQGVGGNLEAHRENQWSGKIAWAGVGKKNNEQPTSPLTVGFYRISQPVGHHVFDGDLHRHPHSPVQRRLHGRGVGQGGCRSQHSHRPRSLSPPRTRFGQFFLFLSLFCFSMLNLVLADNLFQVFVSWELVGVCSYLLIGFYYERQSASNAANKAFITNRVGDAGFIIGVLILWTTVGTLNFEEIFQQIRSAPGGCSWQAIADQLGGPDRPRGTPKADDPSRPDESVEQSLMIDEAGQGRQRGQCCFPARQVNTRPLPRNHEGPGRRSFTTDVTIRLPRPGTKPVSVLALPCPTGCWWLRDSESSWVASASRRSSRLQVWLRTPTRWKALTPG